MGRTIMACGLLLAVTGCADDDRARLEKIGKLSHQRVRTVFPAIPVSLDGLREATRSGGPGSSLEVRVRSRFRSDKLLTGKLIEVRETEPGKITLSGNVAGPQEKGRALELARSAEGVQTVVDELGFAE